jgi:hypothetical protein
MALESICPGMFHAEAGEAKGSNGQVSRPRPAFAKVLFWLLSISGRICHKLSRLIELDKFPTQAPHLIFTLVCFVELRARRPSGLRAGRGLILGRRERLHENTRC